ncbi:ComF family protein [Parabacteroides sp. OttesenSCG-928-N08]|nr:ComF family protein [Parabacteroides sp. OttesenSCG-928-N08]
MITYLRRIGNDLINLFYPNTCLLCEQKLLEGEELVCLNCLNDLPRTPFFTDSETPITELFADKRVLKSATAWLYFYRQGGVQRLVHSFKYYGNRRLAYLLGRQMGLTLLSHHHPLMEADFIVPVPLHPKKQRKRGYNQSEWIARGVSDVTAIPLHRSILTRSTHTKTQTLRSDSERWLNVKGAFSTLQTEGVEGKHLLLIDDVITSGSTIRASMDALERIPDVRISVLVLTMA